VVDGVTSSEGCSNLTACELPNGDIRYDLTAEQCVGLPGQCSGECAQPICRPYSRYNSSACAIYLMENETLCKEITAGTGKIDSQKTCITFEFTKSDCDNLNRSYNSEYITCESLDLASCNLQSMNYIQRDYLFCGKSDFSPCQTKHECESFGGTCSDSMWMRSTADFSTIEGVTQRSFYYGICSTSGFSFFSSVYKFNPLASKVMW
jgi:hypothetical protein